METPLHLTPMEQPMMKGKIDVDASNKPTFQGIWGMTHAEVTQEGGFTNPFKVVRVESMGQDGVGRPPFAGKYLGHFDFTANNKTEMIKESFTLHFKMNSNKGYNVYGHGENCFGQTDIVGTMTKTGEMEIFKMPPGTTNQPAPSPAISSRKPPRRLGCKRKRSAVHHPSKRGRKRSGDDERPKKKKSEVDDGEVDLYWIEAQQEKREREEREKRMAAEHERDNRDNSNSKLQENDFDVDFEGEDDDEEQKEEKSEVDDGEVDLYWVQAQREKREREEREKRKAAEQKELNELLIETLKQRNQELREEALRYNRERAAEKARQERLKQKAIEERMAAERRIRDEQRDTIDLDPVRRHPLLMALMDASVYDD